MTIWGLLLTAFRPDLDHSARVPLPRAQDAPESLLSTRWLIAAAVLDRVHERFELLTAPWFF
jgi:hypothetical protein